MEPKKRWKIKKYLVVGIFGRFCATNSLSCWVRFALFSVNFGRFSNFLVVNFEVVVITVDNELIFSCEKRNLRFKLFAINSNLTYLFINLFIKFTIITIVCHIIILLIETYNVWSSWCMVFFGSWWIGNRFFSRIR